MTKHVTFIKPDAGISVGQRRLVPDEVAARLDREGRIEANPPSFPATSDAPERPKRRQTYQTKTA